MTDKDLADQLFNEYMDSLDKLNKAVNQILNESIDLNKTLITVLNKQKKVLLK